MFVRFLHFNVTLLYPPLLLYCTHWKEVLLHSSYLRIGKLYSPSSMVEYLHHLFGILTYGRFVSLLPFIYINMDSDLYVIICIIIQILFQLWTLGTLFSCLLCPFDMSPFFFFLSTFLLSGIIRCSRLILYAAVLRISYFLRILVSFYHRVVLEPRYMYLLLLGCCFL